MRRCLANPDASNYEEACLTTAAKVHADLIRVHPFEDGNGRSTRLFMCSVLIKLGMLPIEVEVPRKEYLDCLNHYFSQRDLRLLVDLCLRLLSEKVRRA
jgi:prophage maintenance system killer protein